MKNHLKVKDKEILIIGSWRPWLEIIALVNGAKEVTSTDYQKIYCDRPNLKLMTTYEFNEKYLNGELPQYDVVISISSVEHSGLGRLLYYLRIFILHHFQKIIFHLKKYILLPKVWR